ncbi:MAG: MCP four helix bundle domain-containing protein [Acidobacteriota bacterium]
MRKSIVIVATVVIIWILAGVLGFTGYAGVRYISMLEEQNQMLYQSNVVPLAAIDQAEILYLDQQLELRDMFLTKDDAAHKKSIEFIRAMDRNIAQDLQRYQGGIHSSEEKDKFQALENNLDKDKATRDKIIALLEANQNQQAMTLFVSYQTQVSHNQYAFDVLQEIKAIQAKSRNADNTVSANKASSLLMSVITISLLLGMVGASLCLFLILRGRLTEHKS